MEALGSFYTRPNRTSCFTLHINTTTSVTPPTIKTRHDMKNFAVFVRTLLCLHRLTKTREFHTV